MDDLCKRFAGAQKHVPAPQVTLLNTAIKPAAELRRTESCKQHVAEIASKDNRCKGDGFWIKRNCDLESSNAEQRRAWQCEECGVLNKTDAWFCKDCRRPRRKTDDHQDITVWQCEECDILNKADAWFCKDCRRPRGKTTDHKDVSGLKNEKRKISHEEVATKSSDSVKPQKQAHRAVQHLPDNTIPDAWQCEQCSIPNKAEAWFCKECRRPRRKTADQRDVSGLKTEREKISQEEFTAKNNDSLKPQKQKNREVQHLPHNNLPDGSVASDEMSTNNNKKGLKKERQKTLQEELVTKNSESLKPHKQEHREVQHLPDNNVPDDDMFYGISHEERRIVLIGKTGSGKSATGNTILGISDGFESKLSGKSITKCCQRREVERFGKKLMVVDTPGLFATSMANERTKEEIGKCIGITSPGPHAIILVVQINRFTEEEQKTVDLFVERFGEGMYHHLIVLFTRKDDLVKMNTSINTYVKGTEQLASILKKCQNRYIAFDNFSPDKDKDVQSLLDMIEDILQKNGGNCYTNNMFTEAEKAMKQRMAAIREEERKKKEQELKDHADKVAKSYEAEIKHQKLEQAKQQKEIEKLESKRQKELEKQRRQEEENRRLKEEKEKIEKQKQKDARDFEVQRKQLEQQIQKEKEENKRKKTEKEEQEKQTRERKEIEKLQEQIEAHERQMREAAKKAKQLKMEMKKERDQSIAEIEEKYKRKMQVEKLREQTRVEVEKKGFWDKVWDIVKRKYLHK